MLSIIASTAFMLSSASMPEGHTARDLVRQCEEVLNKNSQRYADQGYCIGYVDGVSTMLHQQMYEDKHFNRDLSLDVCEPQGVTNEERVKIILRYADQHPEILHEPSAGLVLVALRASFPCPVVSR